MSNDIKYCMARVVEPKLFSSLFSGNKLHYFPDYPLVSVNKSEIITKYFSRVDLLSIKSVHSTKRVGIFLRKSAFSTQRVDRFLRKSAVSTQRVDIFSVIRATLPKESTSFQEFSRHYQKSRHVFCEFQRIHKPP